MTGEVSAGRSQAYQFRAFAGVRYVIETGGDGDTAVAVWDMDQKRELLRNDDGGAFVDVTSGPLGDTGLGFGVAWGDYDNDGDLDLYLANYNSANKLFRNDGGGAFVDVTSGPLGDTGGGQGVAWGDYDNDGDLDLYLANFGEANKLLRNEATAGQHWLQVKLQGTLSNRAGIGARVRVVAGGESQIREISGGSGFLSQDAMVASFGLGAATMVDSLIVSWPSGIVNAFTQGIVIDRQLTVGESQGGATGVETPSQVHRTQLFAAIPNPFNPRTAIRFELEHATHATLRVFDVAGRLVNTLVDEWRNSGLGEAIWQGKDSSGKQVASGVYLYQLHAGDFVETKRMVLLK